MSKLAITPKYALMICQELHVAELRLWLLRLWQLTYVKCVELEIFEILVHEAISQIFLVSALSVHTTRHHTKA